MGERGNARRNLLVVVAVLALCVSAVGAVALAQGDEGDVFSGCLNENSGVLKRVAVGFEPTGPCNEAEVQITWDRAGPAFEERIAELEERVAELEQPFGTLDLFVDCDAGDTVGDALIRSREHLGPVSITISGVCEENVSINRDEVFLSGLSREDGIRASTADGGVSVGQGYRAWFDNMTMSGGEFVVPSGSSVVMRNCTVQDSPRFGVFAFGGGSLEIIDSLITNNADVGLLVDSGAAVWMFSVSAIGNRTGAVAQAGGTIKASNSAFEQNTEWGIQVLSNGTVEIGGSRVASNGLTGVNVGTVSMFEVQDTVIEGNGGSGILASQASGVVVFTTEITSNTLDGITLEDQSNGTGGFRFGTRISDNGGWGINCAGPPAIAPVQNQFDIPAIQFSGNTNGDTNCP